MSGLWETRGQASHAVQGGIVLATSCMAWEACTWGTQLRLSRNFNICVSYPRFKRLDATAATQIHLVFHLIASASMHVCLRACVLFTILAVNQNASKTDSKLQREQTTAN